MQDVPWHKDFHCDLSVTFCETLLSWLKNCKICDVYADTCVVIIESMLLAIKKRRKRFVVLSRDIGLLPVEAKIDKK